MSPVGGIPPIGLMPLMPTGLGIGATERTTAGAAGAVDAVPAAGPGSFGDTLTKALGGLNDQMTGSDRLSEMAATGALADPTSALVEAEKADLAFNMAVQVRNRLVEGWQEISRMGV
jgi:flagellar hook-basal body complex protein FliE